MGRNSTIKSYSEKIEEAIKEYFDKKVKDELYVIEVSNSEIPNNIHVLLVSDYFKGKNIIAIQEDIYKYMKNNIKLSDEEDKNPNKELIINSILAKISLFFTLTKEEYGDM